MGALAVRDSVSLEAPARRSPEPAAELLRDLREEVRERRSSPSQLGAEWAALGEATRSQLARTLPLAPLPLGALVLCALVALAAVWVGEAAKTASGLAVADAIVIALVLGMLVGRLAPLPALQERAVRLIARFSLEFAVVLLGLTIDLRDVVSSGLILPLYVTVGAAGALGATWLVGRLLGLAPPLAMLMGTGNAICGNSAVAATAPVIGAEAKDTAAVIAVGSTLSIGYVLLAPALAPLLGLADRQYGAIVGMSGYAVPHVVAASFAVSDEAGQVAAFIKLLRVLLLGPLVLALGLIVVRRRARPAPSRSALRTMRTLLPWFVIGFMVLAVITTLRGAPAAVASAGHDTSRILFIVAMAGLGLSVNRGALRHAAARVALASLFGMTLLVALGYVGSSLGWLPR